jgi:hypothetical protein
MSSDPKVACALAKDWPVIIDIAVDMWSQDGADAPLISALVSLAGRVTHH